MTKAILTALALALAGSAALADGKGIIWMESGEGGAVKADGKSIIWMDNSEGSGVKTKGK